MMTSGLAQICIFVSRPGGMESYSSTVRELVAQNNPRWQRDQGVIVRCFSFEDVVSTLAPAGPQAAINKETVGQYDIYLGLMGPRFGAATSAYGSGTEEEYMLAVKASSKKGSKVQVAFGFSHESCDPFSLEPEQLQKVKDFIKRIAPTQIYFTWKTKAEFKTKVGQQLDALVYRTIENPVQGGVRYKLDKRLS